MPKTNNAGQPIGRIRKTIETHDAFTRNVNLQDLADDEDWRRRAMAAQRAATRWRSRFESEQKKRKALEDEVAQLKAQAEAADELIQRLEDHLHQAEAIGDFSYELRDRRMLQDERDAYQEECKRLETENKNLRRLEASLRAVCPFADNATSATEIIDEIQYCFKVLEKFGEAFDTEGCPMVVERSIEMVEERITDLEEALHNCWYVFTELSRYQDGVLIIDHADYASETPDFDVLLDGTP